MSIEKEIPKTDTGGFINQISSVHNFSLAAKEDSLNTTDHITANSLTEPAMAANDSAQAMVEAKNKHQE